MDIQVLHGRLRGLAVEYDYLYPPLFRDLSVYVPRMNVELEKDRAAPRDVVRVAACDELIRIRKYHPPTSSTRCGISIRSCSWSPQFICAFCRYLWEAHPVIPI
jgi:hypothetical protein